MPYKRNYIKQAILQFFVNDESCFDFENHFKQYGYSKLEDVKKQSLNIPMDSSDKSAITQNQIIQRRYQKDKLTILFEENKISMFLTDADKFSFNCFLEEIDVLFKDFFDGEKAVIRIGLRYTNIFPPIFDSTCFSKNVNHFLEDSSSYESAYRLMNSFEYYSDDYRIIKKIGFYNPKIPAIYPKNKELQLDYDVILESVSIDDLVTLKSHLEKQRSKIDSLFEDDITDKMRNVLNG